MHNKLNEDICFDFNEKMGICMSPMSLGKLAGLALTLYVLMSSKSDLKFFIILFILFLIGEIVLNSVSGKSGFEVPDEELAYPHEKPVRSRPPNERTLVGDGTGGTGPKGFLQASGYSGGEMDIPERHNEIPGPGKHIGRGNKLREIHMDGDPAARFALKQSVDWDKKKHKMRDMENDYFRDQYERGRLHVAIGESNLTNNGYHYGAPQETRMMKKVGQYTYLDSMGIYPGGHNGGSFHRTESPLYDY